MNTLVLIIVALAAFIIGGGIFVIWFVTSDAKERRKWLLRRMSPIPDTETIETDGEGHPRKCGMMRIKFCFLMTMLAIIVVAGCSSEPFGVTIGDRYWEWDKEYTYRKVTGSIGPNNQPKAGTKTVTRCVGNSIGRSLPETAPQMPCTKAKGDDENDEISYYITYRRWESETQRTIKIRREKWGEFYPGAELQIMVGFGYASVAQ